MIESSARLDLHSYRFVHSVKTRLGGSGDRAQISPGICT